MAQKRGRPKESANVQATPLFRNPPDIEKLGRAILNLAEYLTDKSKSDTAKIIVKGDDHAA